MAIDYFLGMPEPDLRAALLAAQQAFLAGATEISVSGNGYSASYVIHQEPRIVIQQLLEKLNALHPDEFPIESITPDTVTRVVFNSNTVSEASSLNYIP